MLRELRHPAARCDIWEVHDREAKVLLATLNRLEGQDAPIRRAQLLHDLLGEMPSDDLAGLIPESKAEIADLHALLEFPADDVLAQLAAKAEEDEKRLPVVLNFVVLPDQAELVQRAVEMASDGIAGRDRKARGLVNLAKIYLEARDHDDDAEPTPEA